MCVGSGEGGRLEGGMEVRRRFSKFDVSGRGADGMPVERGGGGGRLL